MIINRLIDDIVPEKIMIQDLSFKSKTLFYFSGKFLRDFGRCLYVNSYVFYLRNLKRYFVEKKT